MQLKKENLGPTLHNRKLMQYNQKCSLVPKEEKNYQKSRG